jgi:phage terminase large subunit
LGQAWWAGQTRIADAIRQSNKVTIKGANSAAKTFTLASIAIWFLHAFEPAMVVTTAPSEQQMLNDMWGEIRKQIRHARAPLLDGLLPSAAKWKFDEDRQMIGIVTNNHERFKGKHLQNMLFIFDEAPGTPYWAIEEAINMCTAPNNRIILNGNPTRSQGFFYDTFQPGSGWTPVTLSCLDHPNIQKGQMVIPGGPSRKWVEMHMAKHCVPLTSHDVRENFDFQWPGNSELWYRPDDMFLCRVMGEFPTQGDDVLFPLWAIENAMRTAQKIGELCPVDIGVDVAGTGKDCSVVFARRGPCVLKRLKWHGQDTDKTKREVIRLAQKYVKDGIPVGTIAIDAIGIGNGVATGLMQAKEEGYIHCENVLAVQVSEKGVNTDTYSTMRAELFYGLSERFKRGEIDLTRIGNDADDFAAQGVHICGEPDSRGKMSVPQKEKLRALIGSSPDDVDALCLAFIDTMDNFARDYVDTMVIG